MSVFGRWKKRMTPSVQGMMDSWQWKGRDLRHNPEEAREQLS